MASYCSVALCYLMICLWNICVCSAQQTLAKDSHTYDPAYRHLQLDLANLKQQMKGLMKQNAQLIKDTAYYRRQNGYAAGSSYRHSGGTSELLCLPEDPEWTRPVEGYQSRSYIDGTEYEAGYDYRGNDPFLKVNTNGQSLDEHNVPCALCYVPGKATVQLYPAKMACPEGWTEEYHGFLMSQRYNHRRLKAVCVDEAPEVLPSGGASHNGALLYFMEATCGSLPCPNYIEGRELTCALCSR